MQIVNTENRVYEYLPPGWSFRKALFFNEFRVYKKTKHKEKACFKKKNSVCVDSAQIGLWSFNQEPGSLAWLKDTEQVKTTSLALPKGYKIGTLAPLKLKNQYFCFVFV